MVCVLGFICLLMCCLAERDVSVFSLCRGIRSQVVKRQILQERKNETKCQKEKLRKSVRNPFSWAKPARYWPEFGEKDEARADAKLWIDFRSRLIVSEKIHACTLHTKSAGGRVVRDVFWQQVRSKFWHCHKGRVSDPCQISLVDLKVKRYVMLES